MRDFDTAIKSPLLHWGMERERERAHNERADRNLITYSQRWPSSFLWEASGEEKEKESGFWMESGEEEEEDEDTLMQIIAHTN